MSRLHSPVVPSKAFKAMLSILPPVSDSFVVEKRFVVNGKTVYRPVKVTLNETTKSMLRLARYATAVYMVSHPKVASTRAMSRVALMIEGAVHSIKKSEPQVNDRVLLSRLRKKFFFEDPESVHAQRSALLRQRAHHATLRGLERKFVRHPVSLHGFGGGKK
jgi:hypothetical protein